MKFEDQGERFSDFCEYRIVECPKCSRPINLHSTKLSCTHCGFNKNFEVDGTWFKYDPLIIPIKDYLEIDCCGNLLWAVNLDHLDFIEKYVAAKLRIRQPNINRSLASRLPSWMKQKKNREEILKGIGKLKLGLIEHGYQRPKS